MSFPVPDPQWRWLLNDAQSFLMLDVGDGPPIETGLSFNRLRDKQFQAPSFSVADSQLYSELLERLEYTSIRENDGFTFLVVINAIASSIFHKEIAAKNWFYQVNHQNERSFTVHDLAAVRSKFGQGDVLLLTQNGVFFHCLLLAPLQLDEQKCLPLFSLLKVSNDRLFEFSGECLTQFG